MHFSNQGPTPAVPRRTVTAYCSMVYGVYLRQILQGSHPPRRMENPSPLVQHHFSPNAA